MKQKKVYLMCGIPGSGKSTFCKHFIESHPHTAYISRDIIRFALLEDGDDYFEHEFDVFRNFYTHINKAIYEPENEYVLIDATHLNERSRNKILNRLDLKNVKLYAVNFIIDFDVAWERNNLREGRSVVPYTSMKNMYDSFEPAHEGEKYTYAEILTITD